MTTAISRKSLLMNTVTFPRKLRDAIPDLCGGRVLKLDSADARRQGRRVRVKLRVCETGNLTGVFDVWVDLELDAARGLAELLTSQTQT